MKKIYNLLVEFFTNKDNTVDVGKVIFTLLGVIITTGITLAIAIINNKRSKKNLFINTITTNRIEWMTKTKSLISDFIVMTETNKNSSMEYYGDTKVKYFYELSRKRNELLLHLNFKGYLDKKISQTILEIEKNIQILSELFSLRDLSDKEVIDLFFKIYNEKEQSDSLISEFKDIIKRSDKPLSKEQLENLINEDESKNLIIDAIMKDFNSYSLEINNKLKNEPRNFSEKINELHNDLLIYTQVYMKVEWERVKKESVGKFRTENDQKLKNRIDVLVKEAKSSEGLNYSFDKFDNYLDSL